MAQILKGATCTYVLTDDNKQQRRMQIELNVAGADNAAKAGDAMTKASTIRTLLQAVTGASVATGNVDLAWYDDAAPAAVAGDSVFRVGVLTLLKEDFSKHSLEIPAITDSLLNSDGNDIESIVAASIQNLVGIYESGGEAFLSDGENIQATPGSILAGRVKFTSSGKTNFQN